MRDGRGSGQEARDRFDHPVEVFDLKVLEPDRENHRTPGRCWGDSS